MNLIERCKLKKEGELTVVLDLDPPRGTDMEGIIQQVQHLPVDFFSVTDNSGSHMRMDSVAAASLLRERLKAETIFHITCRDRNLIGSESYLLGAVALGLQNVLTMTGDAVRDEDREAGVRGVFHFNSIRLVELAGSLNEGITHSGRKLRGKTNLCIGTTANPNVYNSQHHTSLAAQDSEVQGLKRKLDAGAQFVLTQPISTPQQFRLFLERYQAHNGTPFPQDVPIFWGVMIPKDYEWARLAYEGKIQLVGIEVPESVVNDMKKGKRGTEVAAEAIQRLHEHGVNHIYLIPPLGGGGRNYEMAQEVLEALGRHKLCTER